MKASNHPVRRAMQQVLRRAGYNLYRLSAEERVLLNRYQTEEDGQTLNDVFGGRLERLQELRRCYEGVYLPVATHSIWGAKKGAGHQADIGTGGVDLRNFRGHSAYVFDYVRSNFEATNLKYYIFSDAVRQKDSAGLLGRLKEDGAFGCVTFEYSGIGRVSRDLLDSIVELNFLHRHLDVLQRPNLKVLDIGAGYGRMAHRMLEANPNVTYTCVDAVPESTFLCEFYLSHRGLDRKVEVVPLHELDGRLNGSAKFDLALNVHSFSECTFAAIDWWLRRLQRLRVPHLMIVPNDPNAFLSTESDGRHLDYAPLLKELGYFLKVKQPVFSEPAVQELLGIRDNMYLFELQAAVAGPSAS